IPVPAVSAAATARWVPVTGSRGATAAKARAPDSAWSWPSMRDSRGLGRAEPNYAVPPTFPGSRAALPSGPARPRARLEYKRERPPDQAGLPTPCAGWDVRDLLSHVIGTLWLTEALFTGQARVFPWLLVACLRPIRPATNPSRPTRRHRRRRWRRPGRATP